MHAARSRLAPIAARERAGPTPDAPQHPLVGSGAHLAGEDTPGAFDAVVPEDSLFVMGDNRTSGASSDSREWGYLPLRALVGEVEMRLLPLRSATTLAAGPEPRPDRRAPKR